MVDDTPHFMTSPPGKGSEPDPDCVPARAAVTQAVVAAFWLLSPAPGVMNCAVLGEELPMGELSIVELTTCKLFTFVDT